jgi:hypothetical protein
MALVFSKQENPTYDPRVAFIQAVGQGKNEIENARSVEVTDVRPDHSRFRCVVGFCIRKQDPSTRTLTLFSGSTVPKMLMKAYYDKVAAHVSIRPPSTRTGAGMSLPQGCERYADRRCRMVAECFKGHATFLDPEGDLAKFDNDGAKLADAVKRAGMQHAWV